MTTQHNPYATPAAVCASTSLDKYVNPMEEESPRSSTTLHETTQEDSLKDTQQHQGEDDREIPVEEEEEPLPPLFHCMLTEQHSTMMTALMSSGHQSGFLSLRSQTTQ